jgi:aspartyl/glutamyl-tRNA(Asn/Gln) amidotransferase C subunit
LTTYTEQLNQILAYAQELEQLNTDNVEPTYHSIETGTVLRADAVKDFPNKAGIIKTAPLSAEQVLLCRGYCNAVLNSPKIKNQITK